MSEDRQPFTEQVTRANRGTDVSKLAWGAAGVLAALLVVALLLWATAVGKLR